MAVPVAPSPAGALAEWAAANPGSRAHHERAGRVLPSGLAHDVRHARPFPLAVARAEGAHKWDVDGHRLVDYVMGHGSLLFGHRDAVVVEAVRAEAQRMLHPGACHDLEARWAEAVVDLVPCAERVRFTSSGTEATLLALRIARAATGRERVVKLVGHFHGWHDAVTLGVDPPFDDRPPGVPAETDVEVAPPDLARLTELLEGGEVAAVILEASGAAWATVPLPGGLLGELRALTRRTGTLLVFDEVVTGFRWAPGGVQELAGVTPDLTALAKVLAGGLPGGAVAGRADVMAVLEFRAPPATKVGHPGTHNAHPLCAAAGVATLERCADGRVQRELAARARGLRAALDAVLARRGVPGRVYGESSTFHLVLGEGLDDPAVLKRGVTGELEAALHCAMLLEGVHLFHASGFLSPAHGDAELERTVLAFDATIERLGREGHLAG